MLLYLVTSNTSRYLFFNLRVLDDSVFPFYALKIDLANRKFNLYYIDKEQIFIIENILAEFTCFQDNHFSLENNYMSGLEQFFLGGRGGVCPTLNVFLSLSTSSETTKCTLNFGIALRQGNKSRCKVAVHVNSLPKKKKK